MQIGVKDIKNLLVTMFLKKKKILGKKRRKKDTFSFFFT
jgi:hypothetical protein